MTSNAVHTDEDIDTILGGLVARGAELNSSRSANFVWVYCRCGFGEHTVAVPIGFDGEAHRSATIVALTEIPCTSGRPV